MVKAMPRTRLVVKDEGRAVIYEGVLVGEILKRAGSPVGPEMRGNAVSSYVLASASDGYQVVFSLAELDPAFTSNDVIVADGDGAVVIPADLVADVAAAAVEQERLEGWIMREVDAGVALPGLYPANEATRARYETWAKGDDAKR